MRYKLLVCDIDGTLLTSAGTLTDRTRNAVQRARVAGLRVTIATGRRYMTAKPIIDALDIVEPVIVQTGALIFDAHNQIILSTTPLPAGVAREAITLLVSERLQPIVYENNVFSQHLYTGPERYDSPGARLYFAGNPELIIRRPYARLVPPDNALQLAVIDDIEQLDRVVSHLQLAGCRILTSYSGNLDSYFMEVFHASCSKGSALHTLANHLGLEMDEIVAVGDNLNDIEMLAMAGLGVAMANAVPQAMSTATRTTLSCDEDGVATLIDEILALDS